jgi:hypothetical protein
MSQPSRHQCLIYEGAPSRHLASVAAVIREKLAQNYRCLYFNSRALVNSLKSYLTAAGIDPAEQIRTTNLIIESDHNHLVNGRFDVDGMIDNLANALRQALSDGYAGLWASGDMTWEMGPDKDFSRLLEYEQRLEEFFQAHPEMSGLCQYHASTLPSEALRHGLLGHRSLFINDTLSLLNPHYQAAASAAAVLPHPALDSIVMRLCHAGELL